jgi:drug/metabolite transporter (DMT)-like permease
LLDRNRWPLAIVGACIAWGLDNNLTRKVSLADPLQIAMLKGLIAGPFNLLLGLGISHEIPSVSGILLTGIVGFLGYGVSLALFVIAYATSEQHVQVHTSLRRRSLAVR